MADHKQPDIHPATPTAKALTLIHNDSCSKSNCLYQYLADQKIVFTLRNYLTAPLTATELEDLTSKLQETGTHPRQLVRLADEKLTELIELARNTGHGHPKDEVSILIQMLLARPELLQRPVLLTANQAVIGRPMEVAIAFLQNYIL